jgi:outer membrane protein assembly factor BamB
LLTTQHVIVGDNWNRPTALSRTDGSVVWKGEQTVTAELNSPDVLGFDDDTLFVYGINSRNRDLTAFGIDTAGTTQTTVTFAEGASLNDVRTQAGTLVDGRVYLSYGSREAAETRLSVREWPSGNVVWEAVIGSNELQLEDMAVDEELIYLTTDEAPSESHNVWVFGRENGNRRWSRRLDIGEGIPVVDDQHVYLPIDVGAGVENDLSDPVEGVYAFEKATGNVAWTFEALNSPRTGVSVDGDRVYIVADGTLYGISPSDGTVQWRFTPPDEGRLRDDSGGLPVVCGDTLLIGGAEGSDGGAARIRAIDKRTGEQSWSFGVENPEIQSPIVGDEALYALASERGNSESKCYCFA